MAVKEFRVLRKTVVEQWFTVKAANATEARQIIEEEADKSKFWAAAWELEEKDLRDRRVVDVSQAEAPADPVFFIRTKDWNPG